MTSCSFSIGVGSLGSTMDAIVRLAGSSSQCSFVGVSVGMVATIGSLLLDLVCRIDSSPEQFDSSESL